MFCHIDYCVNGKRVHTTIEAASSIDALLLVLETLPPTAGVKAIVRVVKPVEVVQ